MEAAWYIFTASTSEMTLNLLPQLFPAHFTETFYLISSSYDLVFFVHVGLLNHPVLAMNEKTVASNLHGISISYL
jgi:hypothetical protein